MSHLFDAAIALEPVGPNRWCGATSAPYANMVGPYGGVTAAQLLHAVMLHPERLGDPVSLTVNYAAAVADGAFEIVARPARTNRSTQHWLMELRQGDETVITATLVTGLRRAQWQGPSLPMPAAPRPLDVPAAGGRGRVEWINRYELRFIEGGYPKEWDGRDSGSSRSLQWVRDNPARPLDFESLTALCDVFFPRIWLHRATFVPLGTVSMTIYFHAGPQQLQAAGNGFLLAQASAQGYHRGFVDQAAQVWTEAGDLIATSNQVLYYKE